MSLHRSNDLFGYSPGSPGNLKYRGTDNNRKTYETDLSPSERYVIGDFINKAARKILFENPKSGTASFVESIRYVKCGLEALDLQCPECHTKYYIRKLCKSRICEVCGRIYRGKLFRTMQDVLKKETAHKKRGYCLSMLTLSVTSKRYGDKMPDRSDIKRFYKETSLFLRLHYGKYKSRLTDKGKIVENRKRYIGSGWIAAIEFGSDNNNLHCHAIVYGPIRKWFELKTSWSSITTDSLGVWIKKVDNPKKAANYVLKYITKPPNTDSYAYIANYSISVKGSRRLRSGGVFYNRIKLPKYKNRPCQCIYCRHRLIYSGDIDLDKANNHIDLYKELDEIDDLGLDTYNNILGLDPNQDMSSPRKDLHNQRKLFH